MGHYAKIKNGLVTQVIVANEKFINSVLFQKNEWIKTSYNTKGGVHYDLNTNEPSEDQSKALRKNYAGIGYTYDSTRDAFIPPKPFNSWTLNEDTCLWDSPIAYPEDGKLYNWNEDLLNWQEVIIEE